MEIEEIYSNLCSYDKRNPYYEDDFCDEEPRKNCHCDNCFYGRDKLALEIIVLKALDLIKSSI